MVTDYDFSQILSGSKEGDVDSLAQLWKWFNPMLVKYLAVVAPTLADDISQDVWISVSRSVKGFEGTSNSFRNYLLTVAKNKVTDYRRAGIRGSRLISRIETQVDTISNDSLEIDRIGDGELIQVLQRFLPPALAEVVFMRYLIGMSVDEVAVVIGRSPENVRVISHRGLSRLRELYGARVPGVVAMVGEPQ
ncbi:sigma-70 family RNA polymerase sigma factor [Acidithrix sp. C25]|uniref:RNA polymerase sigma factor n=1 Tax=Acidithrix sp. C25 TaxID=1671482 RepID=UPI00191B91A3|nr:sigma-70 family RNA polymerase sigma factor [Acidithrix sp. C25]CAG4914590.1 unnamed protein product [Acidithrix sp. C25]